VAIRDGRVVTLGYRDEREYVSAVSTETGEQLWMVDIGPAVQESKLMRWLGQRTPTIDEERVYAVRSDGDIVCLAAEDGREVWRKKCPEEFGTRAGSWGFCDYPLVDGEHLICRPGGSKATVVALNRKSGEVVWDMVVPERRHSHAATIVSEGGGVRQYLTSLHPKGLLSVAARDGGKLWLYDGLNTRTASSVTPLVRADVVLAFNGYGAKRARLVLAKSGENGVKIREDYLHRGSLNPFQDSTVWIGERVYALRGANRLACYEAASGELVFDTELSKGRCAMTYADGHLYVLSSEGTISLLKVTDDQLLARSQIQFPEHESALGASNPVIAGGRLWLRNDDRLFCYDLRPNGPRVQDPPKRITLVPKRKKVAAGDREDPGVLRSVFVPTPSDVVKRMLEVAAVKKGEVVYDLGSGDGRIVIAAARDFGAKAVGYEIDRELVEISRKAAKEAGVAERVTIVEGDLFKADLKKADVIAVFLLPKQLKALRPKIDQLRPGTRIVSHQFEIPEAKASRSLQVESKDGGGNHPVYLYTVPLTDSEGAPSNP
jgi:outer membrane protein assembly factor BamB/protein-L-isoaspartate O-methyltransferase